MKHLLLACMMILVACTTEHKTQHESYEYYYGIYSVNTPMFKFDVYATKSTYKYKITQSNESIFMSKEEFNSLINENFNELIKIGWDVNPYRGANGTFMTLYKDGTHISIRHDDLAKLKSFMNKDR